MPKKQIVNVCISDYKKTKCTCIYIECQKQKIVHVCIRMFAPHCHGKIKNSEVRVFKCNFICMIYLYVCTYTYIYVYTYMRLCARTGLCRCILKYCHSIYIHVDIFFLYIYICVYMYIYIYTYVCIYLRIQRLWCYIKLHHVYIYKAIYTCTRLYICTYRMQG